MQQIPSIDIADILYLYMNCGLYDRLIYSNLDKIYCRKESTAKFHGRCRRQEVRFIDLHLFHSRIIQLISCIMLPLNEKPHYTFYHFLTTLSRYFFQLPFQKVYAFHNVLVLSRTMIQKVFNNVLVYLLSMTTRKPT